MCLSESDFAVMLCLDSPLFFSCPGTNMWASNWHITKKSPSKKHIQTKHQDSPSLSQMQTITNMTYQSPAQWSRTKDPLFMEHTIVWAFSWVVACDVAPGRCDSQHVGIILKQPSICQGYAFSLKVLSSLLLCQKESARKGGKKTECSSRIAKEREVCRSKGVCSGQIL